MHRHTQTVFPIPFEFWILLYVLFTNCRISFFANDRELERKWRKASNISIKGTLFHFYSCLFLSLFFIRLFKTRNTFPYFYFYEEKNEKIYDKISHKFYENEILFFYHFSFRRYFLHHHIVNHRSKVKNQLKSNEWGKILHFIFYSQE